MKHLGIGLLAAVTVGLGIVGAAQAHDFDREGGRHGVQLHQGHKAHKQRAHSRGDSRYQHYLDKRQARQQHRIEEGWCSGELTGKEMKRLRKNQRRIAHLERKFTADGHLSRRERQVLRGVLDEASAGIHRKKHNDRYRVARHRDQEEKAHAEAFGLWSDGLGFVWYDRDS